MDLKKLIIFFTIYFSCLSIIGEDSVIHWDINNSFINSIYKEKNVELNYVDNIPAYYSIKKKRYDIDNFTDLYLSFDDNKDYDETNRYKFIYKKFHHSQNIAIYKKSAYFIGEDERLELIGTKKSFFQSGVNLGSFTISFWVYPASFSNNEIVLRIGSQYYNENTDSLEDQSIKAKMIDGRLCWEFNNIFISSNLKKSLLVIKSYSRILPEKWSFVNLTFDSNRGIIREYIDGIEEGILIATEDGTLNSTVLNLQYHPTNRCIIMIAPTFYGAIDEFCIVKKIENINFKKYDTGQGELISNVKDFGEGGIYINKIIPEGVETHNTDLIYFYRYSLKPFDQNDMYSPDIKWHVLSLKNSKSVLIRFFQWKVLFLSGDNGDYSPRFRKLTIKYTKNNPPAKPRGLKVISSEKKVVLKWIMNSEKDLKGYKVYYGTNSGNYFGYDANEGNSPVDVGLLNKFEITGLKSNLIYYFVITAYDDDNHTHESSFSEEISVRVMGN